MAQPELQADNAAFGDSGLPYRFPAALRLIKSLRLRNILVSSPALLAVARLLYAKSGQVFILKGAFFSQERHQ